MKIVAGFDSQFEEAEVPKVPDLSKYKQIFEALSHNHEVAENAFSRVAKTHFRAYVDGDVQRKTNKEVSQEESIRVAMSSCSFNTSKTDSKIAGSVLSDLVNGFSQYLLSEMKGGYLIEALQTTIMRIGETLYLFRLKQKWGKDV